MKQTALLKKIDNYYLDQGNILGRGAYSTVYKGINIQTGSPVAIKAMKLTESEQLQDLMKKEVKHLQLIDNDNVVRLWDVKKYKIFENKIYCNGVSLDTMLRKNSGRLVEKDAIKYFQDIVNGMKALCENGMVHRDLKPANILINNFQAKIADFGFSKLLDIDHHLDEAVLTSTVGTIQYMSPQLLEGAPYSSKSDIWSLGILLFEILYGHPPYRAQTQYQLLQEINQQQLQFPDSPQVSHLTKSLITNMLKIEEQDRVNWNQIFNHEIVTQTHQEQLKTSLESFNRIENGDHMRKVKELSKLFFEQNKIVTSYVDCLQRENLNKLIVKDHLNQNNLQDDQSNLCQKLKDYFRGQQYNDKDLSGLLQKHRSEQENFQIFNDITSRLLHRRNKAVFFYLTSIYIYESYFEDNQLQEIEKDLIVRFIYLLQKYSLSKIYKIYKNLKNNTCTYQTANFSSKQWELYMRSEQRTHILNFVSFDFEMLQLFHDKFLIFTKALMDNINQSSNQFQSIDQESDGCDELLGLQSTPTLFPQEFDMDLNISQSPSVPFENKLMIRTFLTHCSKKLRPKKEFIPILEGTVKLVVLRLSEVKDPSQKTLLNLNKARCVCQDWSSSLVPSAFNVDFWGKFYENFDSQSKEQLYMRLIGIKS